MQYGDEAPSSAQKTATHGLCVIAEGGGLKAAFVTGAMAALNDNVPGFSFREVDVFVVSSACVGNVFNYFSEGDRHIARKMWTQELTDPAFVKRGGLLKVFGREPVIDIDYLVDVIFRKRNPFNEANIRATKQRIYFPLYNCDSGEDEVFANVTTQSSFQRGARRVLIRPITPHQDLYELLRAAKAVPVLYGKTVLIDGKRYADGGTLEPFTLDIPETKQMRKIIILSERREDNVIGILTSSLVWTALAIIALLKGNMVQVKLSINTLKNESVSRKRIRELRTLEKNGEALIIEPQDGLGGALDNSPETLRKSYDMGQSIVRDMQDKILAFVHA